MNIRKDEGITLVALTTIVIVALLVLGISVTGTLMGNKEAESSSMVTELNIIQHAILERYTKAQITKETLPGKNINKEEVEKIIEEINKIADDNIQLKGTEYKELSSSDLENLGITNENDIYIVNYKTGEVINKTVKVTNKGKALYIYSKNEN